MTGLQSNVRPIGYQGKNVHDGRSILNHRRSGSWTVRVTVVGACLLLLSSVLVFHFRASPHSLWRQSGLAGQTVHYLVLADGSAAPNIAATEKGLYTLSPDRKWLPVLTGDVIWSALALAHGHTIIGASQQGYVYVSRDAGMHWQRRLLTPDGVFAVTVQPGEPAHVLAGAGGGIYESRDEGRHWYRRLALHNAGGSAFAWQPGKSTTVYVGAVASDAQGSAGVFVSRDAGRHWHVLGRHLKSYGGIMSLDIPASTLYAGTMGNRLWSTSSPSFTWHPQSGGMPPGQHVSGISSIPNHPNDLFVSTLGEGVFRSQDAGNHWVSVSDGLPGSATQKIVLTVEYSPVDQELYAGTTDGIYRMPVKP